QQAKDSQLPSEQDLQRRVEAGPPTEQPANQPAEHGGVKTVEPELPAHAPEDHASTPGAHEAAAEGKVAAEGKAAAAPGSPEEDLFSKVDMEGTLKAQAEHEANAQPEPKGAGVPISDELMAQLGVHEETVQRTQPDGTVVEEKVLVKDGAPPPSEPAA